MNISLIDIDSLITIAREAGKAIMKVYETDFSVETKDDTSPLTLADKASNEVIVTSLQKLHPNIPIISEENKLIAYGERKNWPLFWLVDPLDGTKEFIKKNGEFTVNIALIENGVPVAGVVYVPVTGKCYYAQRDTGSFCINPNEAHATPLKGGVHYSQKSKVKVVASRSHLTDETLAFVEQLKTQGKEVDFLSSGSSLKLCLVAEGAADVYPRFGPTMEWDTAAAHAIALYAGRSVLNANTREPLTYNKENLLNPYFIVE